MINVVTEGPLVTKFVIGDLALRSALQLEKARKRRVFSADPLRRLAAALRQTSFPTSADSAAALRPGFYEAFSRVSIKGQPPPPRGMSTSAACWTGRLTACPPLRSTRGSATDPTSLSSSASSCTMSLSLGRPRRRDLDDVEQSPVRLASARRRLASFLEQVSELISSNFPRKDG